MKSFPPAPEEPQKEKQNETTTSTEMTTETEIPVDIPPATTADVVIAIEVSEKKDEDDQIIISDSEDECPPASPKQNGVAAVEPEIKNEIATEEEEKLAETSPETAQELTTVAQSSAKKNECVNIDCSMEGTEVCPGFILSFYSASKSRVSYVCEQCRHEAFEKYSVSSLLQSEIVSI
jgi:hypothetical protein